MTKSDNKPVSTQSNVLPAWATAGLLIFFIVAAAFASYMVYVTAKQWATNRDTSTTISRTIDNNIDTFTKVPVGDLKTNTDNENELIETEVSDTNTTNTSDGLRTTILLMGIDKRQGMEKERAGEGKGKGRIDFGWGSVLVSIVFRISDRYSIDLD